VAAVEARGSGRRRGRSKRAQAVVVGTGGGRGVSDQLVPHVGANVKQRIKQGHAGAGERWI
jgi:hypothetical protein